MIKQVVLDSKDYDELVLQANTRKNGVHITISGLDRSWLWKDYYNSKYEMTFHVDKGVSEDFYKNIKKFFDEELDELNIKVKEFINLKGEIEVLKKLTKE